MSSRLPAFYEKRLKFIADIVMGQSAPPDSINHDGVGLPFLQGCSEFGGIHPTPDKFSTSAPKESIAGDWLMSVRAPVGKLNRADRDYGIGRGLCAVRAIVGTSEPRFLGYALAAAVPELQSHATGSTYDAVAIEDVANMVIGVPQPAEQSSIADFLDRETAKINALIAKQEALIERINEKRAASITKLVLRGVNDKATLKPSGFDWIGDIPQHWAVRSLGSAATKITNGYVGPTRDIFVETGVTYLQSLHIKNNRILFNQPYYVSAEWSRNHSKSILAAGDVLIVQTGDIGQVSVVPHEFVGANCHALIVVSTIRDVISGEYLSWVLNSDYGFNSLKSIQTGALHPHLNCGAVKFIQLPIPPLDEQHLIVNEVVSELAKYDELKTALARQIELSAEHRSALITAAVTGQIDVCAAPIKTASVASNDNQQTLRVVVGAEIVARHGAAKNFGRVKFQKLLYLAEVHTGISELCGSYVREAAGPLARDLLSQTEQGMATSGFYKAVAPVSENDGVAYERIGAIGAHHDQFTALVGENAAPLTKLIDLLKDYSTRDVEAITTLYAVWNDALLDGEDPDDARIIRGFLDEWHPEKRVKFKAADLPVWLAWMRRNGVVPSGSGAHTYTDQLFV